MDFESGGPAKGRKKDEILACGERKSERYRQTGRKGEEEKVCERKRQAAHAA